MSEHDHPSLIIVLDDHTQVHQSVDAIAGQTALPERLETIVVNPYTNHEGTQWALEQIDTASSARIGLQVIKAEGKGRAACRNRAIEHASGGLFILLGDDFVPHAQWLAPHLQLHQERPEENVVGIGPAFFTERAREDALMAWLDDSGYAFGVSFSVNRPIPPNFFYGANTSIKRDFLLRAGLFDERFPYHTTDDWEMGLRLVDLGMESVYLPEAIAWHHHPQDLQERKQSMMLAGISSAIYDSGKGQGRTVPSMCQHSAWGHRWRTWLAKLRWRISGNARAREVFWAHALATAYMSGYEDRLRRRR